MRAYVITSGIIFLAIALVHVARLLAERGGPLYEPMFVVASLVALIMAAWAAMSLGSAR